MVLMCLRIAKPYCKTIMPDKNCRRNTRNCFYRQMAQLIIEDPTWRLQKDGKSII